MKDELYSKLITSINTVPILAATGIIISGLMLYQSSGPGSKSLYCSPGVDHSKVETTKQQPKE